MITIIFSTIVLLCSFVAPAFSANYALNIIQPQPSLGTYNRFYRAYPGLEYNVRVSAVGGDYPYTYSLTTSPAGMTINPATGEISWSNPTTSGSPHSISVMVTDSESSTDTVSWALTVTTSDFIFVAPSGAGSEDGSSCANAMQFEDMYGGAVSPTIAAARDDDTYAGYFMYFCDGTYAPTSSSMYLEDSWRFVFRYDSKPQIWLAYPGTSPVIDLSGGVFEVYSGGDNIFISGLTFDMGTNPDVRLFRIAGGINNATFYKNTFDGNAQTGWIGGNNSLLFLTGSASTGDPPNNFAIVNNTFRDINSGCGIEGYTTNTMLVENNSFSSVLNHSIYPKMGTTNWTIRGNTISQASGNGILVGNYVTSGDMEILYNYVDAGSGNAIHLNEQYITTSSGPFYAHRNTLVGTVQVNQVESTNGPFEINNNAIEGSYVLNAINYSANLDTTNNIQETSGVVDENGDLEAEYSAYIGTIGWQFADGSTPMDSSYTPPGAGNPFFSPGVGGVIKRQTGGYYIPSSN